MKIQQLIEDLYQPEVTDKQWRSDFQRPDRSNAEKGRLGKGYYSSVYDTNDPHMVKKRPDEYKKGDHDRDGYWVYAKALVDKKKWEDNPYFPRIYSFKKLSDPSDKATYSVKMERLLPFDSVKKNELEFLAKKMFGMDERNFELAYESGFRKHEDSEFRQNVARVIAALINSQSSDAFVEEWEDEGVKLQISNFDKKLLAACKFIHDLMYFKRLRLDMHDDNLMVRRGPHGLQIVITDPYHDNY